MPTEPAGGGPWRAAVDIGGTFTDLVLVDPAGRCAATGKLLTTPDDPARALLQGLGRLLEDAGLDPALLGNVVHGTTLVTNALIERRGAATGLITTAGFRDVLEIGREARYDLYDLDIDLPAPLVRRRWREEVPERTLATGEVKTAVDLPATAAAARRLAAEGVTSIAVCFLHSYLNDGHERAAGAEIRRACPEVDVTLSVDVLPEIREFARMSTTVANAYVRPLVRGYLGSLQDAIGAIAPGAKLEMVASTGTVTPAGTASEVPIRLLESGPAGGVLEAARIAAEAGIEDAIAFDMGGTTAKASYVRGGRPALIPSFEVARVRRFARGSGLPIQVPSVQLIEIGAGGGSVAWVDGLGLLRVGPRSAGSMPGPACYGLGGLEPTVTDADLVLGHLGADSFLGGEMALDVAAARRALEALAPSIGAGHRGGAEEVAQAVRAVVDEQMAAAARMHATEQGLDPADFTLVATGGAGPVHACSIARILRIRRVLVPGRAGLASAHGFLGAPAGFDVARSAPSLLESVDWAAVRALLGELEAEARRAAPGSGLERRLEADLRYRGQGDVITVQVRNEWLEGGEAEALRDALAGEYTRRYGRVPDGVPAEVLTWRVGLSAPPPAVLPMEAGPRSRARGSRLVYHPELAAYAETPVIGWQAAEDLGRISGPAIIEERESTLVVPPEASVSRAGESALLVEL